MRNFIHLILTFMVSFFAFCGAISMKSNPWPGFAVAFGVWGLFLWRYHVRAKRNAMKKQYEEWMFREYMRSRPNNQR